MWDIDIDIDSHPRRCCRGGGNAVCADPGDANGSRGQTDSNWGVKVKQGNNEQAWERTTMIEQTQ